MAQLSKRVFDALQTTKFSNSTHINGFFIGHTGHDFIDWFNLELGGKGAFANRKIAPNRNKGEDMTTVKREFVEFWDAIPLIFRQPDISLFEFAALVCIAINETGGRFGSVTEKVGSKGLAYTFNAKGKKSYNTLKDAGNVTAYTCFTNPVFCRAHAGLGMSDVLSGADNPLKISEIWKGEVYPPDPFPAVSDLAITGFIMQADFYKFRGRGPIQITGRAVYREIVKFIQGYTGSNEILHKFKNRWQNLSPDDACFASNDLDWDEIFTVNTILSLSLGIYSDRWSKKNIFVLEKTFDRLNADTMNNNIRSIWSVGRKVSGIAEYANNTYKPRVVEMLNKIADSLHA